MATITDDQDYSLTGMVYYDHAPGDAAAYVRLHRNGRELFARIGDPEERPIIDGEPRIVGRPRRHILRLEAIYRNERKRAAPSLRLRSAVDGFFGLECTLREVQSSTTNEIAMASTDRPAPHMIAPIVHYANPRGRRFIEPPTREQIREIIFDHVPMTSWLMMRRQLDRSVVDIAFDVPMYDPDHHPVMPIINLGPTLTRHFAKKKRRERKHLQQSRARVKRSLKFAQRYLGEDIVKDFLSEDGVVIEGDFVNWHFGRRISLGELGHSGLEVTAVHQESGEDLFGLCLYIEETPPLDQLAAFCMFIETDGDTYLIQKAGSIWRHDAYDEDCAVLLGLAGREPPRQLQLEDILIVGEEAERHMDDAMAQVAQFNERLDRERGYYEDIAGIMAREDERVKEVLDEVKNEMLDMGQFGEVQAGVRAREVRIDYEQHIEEQNRLQAIGLGNEPAGLVQIG